MRWGRLAAIVMLVTLIGLGLALRVVPTPIVAVASGSMSPTLERGDLVVVGPPPADLQLGDIVVVQVPLSIQERYNYPPAIVHRIVKVDHAADGSASYRTKGDSGPEDAFTVYPADVQGVVGSRVAYAGYPILFLYSPHGLVFLVGSAAIYGAYLASSPLAAWARRGVARVASAVGSAALEETRQLGQATQERFQRVEGAMESFSSAMREYATHLQSHTRAVQEMAQAAHDIRTSVAIQQEALVAALGRQRELVQPATAARNVAESPPPPAPEPRLPAAEREVRIFQFAPSAPRRVEPLSAPDPGAEAMESVRRLLEWADQQAAGERVSPPTSVRGLAAGPAALALER